MNDRNENSEHVKGVLAHKRHVQAYLDAAALDLAHRARVHDDSKFTPEELDAFERMTPVLATLTYGSPEYKDALQELGPALAHHYRVNDHHPEHFPQGIDDMNLLQLLEMVCDWLAAVRRVKDGNIFASLAINKERFHIGDQLYAILVNTVYALKEC